MLSKEGGAVSILKEFKEFAVKGNVVDLAVAVVIGTAFGAIVKSLVNDVIMPAASKMIGGLDFSNYYIPLNNQGAHLALAEAKKAGAVIAYGSFIMVVINFIIVSFSIFVMVKAINKAKREQPEPEPEPEVTPEDILLLREIRDALNK